VSRGLLAEAEAALRKASERKLGIPELLSQRFWIAYLKSDRPEMQRVEAEARDRFGPGDWIQDWISDREGAVLAYSGQLQQARVRSRRAVDLARQGGHLENAAQHEAGIAVREVLFGIEPQARRSALASLALSKGRDAEYGAALALALSGDSSRAQALAEDLEKRAPEDTFVRFSYLPVLRAVLALNRREPLKAIELLQTAAPYELGTEGDSIGFEGSLYPIYIRGEAYRAIRKGVEAAAEYQKILDHPGIVLCDPIGVLARLQLGRAFVLAGDQARAKRAYQDFLTLWKDADPDIPVFKQAKAEYAAL
jgi:hypothetical protein